MHAIQKLKAVLRVMTGISETELDFFCQNLTSRNFVKGDFLCREGQVENYIFFIISGATRNYFSKDGKEFTVGFHFDNEFVTAYYSLLTRQPSPFSIEAVEPVEAILIPEQFLNEFYENSRSGDRIGRLLAQAQYIRRIEREMELMSLTAEERYIRLLEKNPKLIQSFSIKHLSSYLGIQPESLSRIRKQYVRN
ncbi:Crp/Fnr family transcriptional regulator [Dyadobacter sp. CY345]|uniref:Crp/Fnr family transcriptional regulator n=1 Tax=Dyadobacter sp. CY345 TaxID=2909335 RepID=UPI001F29D906|nr:Crp/Fnr family transcriptional regulator [Dyadobacter sp. CY345]MCF2446474.1 Crp/Fnr family transcriptional regulator [Dyadobacter sp. CY345]